MFQVIRFFVPNSLANYNHLLFAPHSRQAIICDPFDAALCLQQLAQHQATAIAILLTHNHADHSRGCAELVARLGLPVYAHPDSDYAGPFLPLAPDGTLDIAPDLTIWHTPGHRFDHLCVTNQARDWLICGDTLFNAGVGNTRQGSTHELNQSVQTLLQRLPDHCQVYPSHDYLLTNLAFGLSLFPEHADLLHTLQQQQDLTPDQRMITTLALEKKINLFLQLDWPPLQQRLAQLDICAHNSQLCFQGLRQLRDQW